MFDHMYRHTDGTRLIGNGPRDRLPNPPRRIGRKFEPALPLEFLDRSHQSDIAFLNQVEKAHTAVQIALGDRYHQAQVRLCHLFFGVFRDRFAFADAAHQMLFFACGWIGSRSGFAAVLSSHALLALDTFLQAAAREFNESCSLKLCEVDGIDQLGDADPQPSDAPVRFARRGALLLLVSLRIKPRYFRNAFANASKFNLLSRCRLAINLNDRFDRSRAVVQFLANSKDGFDADRRTSDGCHNQLLAPFNLLCQRNFLLTLQQWNGAQRGQIGAYRIVGIVLARLILDSVFVEQALPFAGLLSFREAVALEDVFVFILSQVLHVIYKSHFQIASPLAVRQSRTVLREMDIVTCYRRSILLDNSTRCGINRPVDSEALLFWLFI